jgi:rhamnopyranosyl-N-acetylglucosaminyl-diphospho-decaprenol beta-1,3/1,4-galactofuranosyltransferase
MNVTCVVVTHNRPALLTQVLDALANQTLRPQTVLVIDNASKDETRQLLARRADVTTLRLETNVGGAGGFAAGVREALALNADWIWLLDDDAVPHHDALELLVDELKRANGKIGALGSCVVEFGKPALQHRRYFCLESLREMPVPQTTYVERAVEIDTASFVGFLLNAKAAQEVGLPNSHFFLAYDDTEYSLRLGRAGWSLWLVPSSVIEHKRTPEGRLRNGPFTIKHYYNLRNRLAVFRHYGRAPWWRLVLPIIMFALVALRDCKLASIKLWYRSVLDSRDVAI